MMFVSRDGDWKVVPVSLNGEPLLRLLHSTAIGTPIQHVVGRRVGLVRMAGGWFWAGDYKSPADVAKFVPLAELTEVSGS
jgi:hypothetical protein